MSAIASPLPPLDLAIRTPTGEIDFRPHNGQWRAWNSRRRFIGVIAGTQSGKTAFGPHWLYREIQQRGPGDYLVVTPTFAILEKKALPEFKKVFDRWLKLGRYVSSPVRRFEFSESGSRRTFGTYDADTPTTVFFGYAEDPDSLESATVKAAWLDEAGQKKFKLGSWEAIQRRLAIHQGRALITTTPYDLGWLKQQVYDRWQDGDPDYDVVRFDSTENPVFPPEEFRRAKETLPAWKFNLFYRGIFTRPAGLIYDSFIDERVPAGHKCPRFEIPAQWPRYLGLDFGGVNTAGVFYAAEPGTRKLYLYRTYKAGGRRAAEHAHYLLQGEPMIPVCVGGSHSEDQWRGEFRAGGEVNGKRVPGLPVMEPPIKDVEVGIDRVYGAHKQREIIVFEDLADYLEEKATYSRKLDDQGEPLEEIEDKNRYHLLDAERYIISHLRPSTTAMRVVTGPRRPAPVGFRPR